MSGGIKPSPWTVSISDCAHGGGLRGDPHLVDPLRVVWFVKTHDMRRPVVSASGCMTVRRQDP